ncbi:MAG: T9SS type A sorting domain-containing protein [Bacteroidia bacterium]|nr:T9SS type A sorting domain-containing protein [Bacteroidia bacterium]
MKTKINNRIRMRTKLRQSLIVFSFLLLSVFLGFFIYFNLGNSKLAEAAVTDEYRSLTSGNWNVNSTWQRYNGSTWVAATATPTSARNIITIRSGHIVTVTANVTVDQVVIESGGSVYLNSGITMTVANGSGTDFNVTGTFRNAGSVTINSSATLAYQNGGVYQHNYTTTAGVIPTATWSTGSTCEIIGYTSNTSTPTGLQAFYNFTWNCPSQANPISLNGGLTTVNGNFSVVSTGSSEFRLAANGSTLNVGVGFSQSGGTFTLSTNATQTSNLNVAGNYSLSGGTFSVVNGNGSTGNVNLSGNYSHTAGTLTHGGNATTKANIVFDKSGTQTFVSPSINVQQNIDFTINTGSILDMGTEICSGRNFTLSSGGGIVLGSPDGITTTGATGNVQVIGTRTFSTGANYTYAGTSTQVTGDALPATVNRLTVNNSANITLTNQVSISNLLTLTSGRILTGANELIVTSTSTSSVTGQSSTSYVVGNLRRSVSSSGAYAFPLGTNSMYELMTITLSSTSGLTSLLGTFVNTNPLDPNIPLSGLQASYVDLDSMLNYGYWTVTPATALTSGTFSVNLQETGYSNDVNSKSVFAVLTRSNAASAWATPGVHTDASPALNGSVATAIRSGLNSFNHFGIGYGQFLAFQNPTLIAGTDGQVGAIYLFPNVCNDIDAWMEIVELAGGATLDDIDNSGAGYGEAFQPFINMAPNATSSIRWKITFKVAGSSTDTIIAKMSMTGVDVDGGSQIREFIEATMPYSYALDLFSTLTITNLFGSYRAVSGFLTINDIDTSHHEAMYQLNYRNVNSLYYRTGAISTRSTVETRQTSLYFRSFMTGSVALPIKLLHFNAKLKNGQVDLSWATAAEINNDFFTIEKSSDAKEFEPVSTVQGAGNSTVTRHYTTEDREVLSGYSYYRLKQTDYDGKYTYSNIVTLKNGAGDGLAVLEVQSVYPNPFSERFTLNYTVRKQGLVNFQLLNAAGKIVAQEKIQSTDGHNSYIFENSQSLIPGVYFIVLTLNDKKVVKKVMKE